MNRIVLYLLLFQALWACTDKKPVNTRKEPPNVIIIITDDQGWGDLSIHGNTNLNTPNIDSLALEGVRFDNFYVQPVCSPSRAELLTGRYAARMGVYSTSAGGERINLGETTIAEIFKAAGYRTALFGKWHSGTQAPYHPNSRGFDEFYGFSSGHWGNYFSPLLEHNSELVRGKGYITDDLTQRALEYIENEKDKPFFILMSYNTPHSPMQVPDEYWNRISENDIVMLHRDSTLEDKNFSRAALAMVENIDHNVGRIRSKIRALNKDSNTIFLFLSDNGPNSWRWNGGMKGRKGSTDEGGVKSPLFISWTKKLMPARVTQIAAAIDLLPTLARLADIDMKTNHPLDGKDLSPLLINSDTDWKARSIFNHWNGKVSVRTQQYRLDHEDNLFDISKDKGQIKDLSTQFPELRDSLVQVKAGWLNSVYKEQQPTIRPFTLGHVSTTVTMFPARDGMPSGNIERSNKYPNCSYFTNWKFSDDKIRWDVEVMESGRYQVELHYSCAVAAIGKRVRLQYEENEVSKKVSRSHNPPLKGMENDRSPRIESYVKDFISMNLGEIHLSKGRGSIVIDVPEISEADQLDVRMLIFRKKN